MTTKEVLRFLQREIHTVVTATTDQNGHPVTCAIDIMKSDENGLYFLTAKGKHFYERLKKDSYMALTGIKGSNTMSCVAVSVSGRVKELGASRLDELFTENPYMNEIYPTAQSRMALCVFQLYEGHGELFDLSKKPVKRFSFALGATQAEKNDYFITDHCTECGKCVAVCPQNCIDLSTAPAVIQSENCLHCGNCQTVCPHGAVVREEEK